jgi:Tfp pilus assembly protein PilN
MTIPINLLPVTYRRDRRRHRRFRLAVSLGVGVIVLELVTGLTLHTRTAATRDLLDHAAQAEQAVAEINQRISLPSREIARLDQQIALARELRTTHRWSRLLGAICRTLPDRVVLVSLATNPPRRSPGRSVSDRDQSSRDPAASAQAAQFVEEITMSGYAVDYGDLSQFVAALQQASVFSVVSFQDARRDRFLGGDAVFFELRCRW